MLQNLTFDAVNPATGDFCHILARLFFRAKIRPKNQLAINDIRVELIIPAMFYSDVDPDQEFAPRRVDFYPHLTSNFPENPNIYPYLGSGFLGNLGRFLSSQTCGILKISVNFYPFLTQGLISTFGGPMRTR